MSVGHIANIWSHDVEVANHEELQSDIMRSGGGVWPVNIMEAFGDSSMMFHDGFFVCLFFLSEIFEHICDHLKLWLTNVLSIFYLGCLFSL